MDTEPIDQTPSEGALHRVLWLIKLLRALVLHMLLALIAVPLYFLAGIEKLSPLATDTFRVLRAQALQNGQQPIPITGPWGAADLEALARTVVPLLQHAAIAPPGFSFESRPIGFFFQGGKLVEIVNRNRTATSYRTAFSYFLSRSLGPAG